MIEKLRYHFLEQQEKRRAEENEWYKKKVKEMANKRKVLLKLNFFSQRIYSKQFYLQIEQINKAKEAGWQNILNSLESMDVRFITLK